MILELKFNIIRGVEFQTGDGLETGNIEGRNLQVVKLRALLVHKGDHRKDFVMFLLLQSVLMAGWVVIFSGRGGRVGNKISSIWIQAVGFGFMIVRFADSRGLEFRGFWLRGVGVRLYEFFRWVPGCNSKQKS